MAVVSIGAAKSGGTTTVALTLASATAAAGVPVLLLDASPGMDLATWSAKSGSQPGLEVLRCHSPEILEQAVSLGSRRGALVLIDAGTSPRMLLSAAECADTVLIPLRLSPLSAFSAVATDTFLARNLRDAEDKQIAFVATAIAQIPSRVARAVEERMMRSPTPKLAQGLAQRAAFEAPFLYGGTIFSLPDVLAPGLHRAREDANALARALCLLPDSLHSGLHRVTGLPHPAPAQDNQPDRYEGVERLAG
jgi:chromosome partitioning protein